MGKEPTQPEQPKLRNIIVSIVITPEGDSLRTDASVSVNGKQAENVQVGLILTGDISLGVSAGAETTRQLRAVATGAVSLAEGLRERSFVGLEQALAQALKKDDAAEPAPPVESDENSVVSTT
jgi:hypothetical protein